MTTTSTLTLPASPTPTPFSGPSTGPAPSAGPEPSPPTRGEDRAGRLAIDAAGRHWTGVPANDPWLAAASSLVPDLAARAAAHDQAGDFVHDGIAALRAAGLVTMLVPESLGGGGASQPQTAAVLATLAHGCPATALTLSMHTHLVAAQVWRHHRDLPAPALAKVAGGALLVSTGASDWLGSNGRAEAVDGGFRVWGRKAPASGAPAGDVLVTSVRWDEAPGGAQVLHCSVPFAAEGLTIEESWDTMGMRATGSHTVVLDGVFVPEAAVALQRPADVWHPVWDVVVAAAMPLIMAVYTGVAEAAAGAALDWAARHADAGDVAAQAGRLLQHLRATQDAVAAMVRAVDDLRVDADLERTSAILTRKVSAAESAIATCRAALDLAGGAGFARTGDIERLLRDAHGSLFHPLTAARQEVFSGRLALGLDPVTGAAS